MRWLLIVFGLGLGGCFKPPSPSLARQQIIILIDNWHKAAAVADETVFFGTMTDEAIYLGTDKTERWTKQEFKEWSQQIFERKTAWAFTPKDRNIYFSEDRKTAWFEELLDTWMGPCRGSGVVVLTENGWKLSHYNLALLVDNDKMNQVIQLLEKG